MFEFSATCREWPLTSSIWPTVMISCVYAFMVKVIGPRWMSTRRALELKPIIFAYNVAMVITNLYLFQQFAVHGWFTTYSWTCQPVDWSPSGEPLSRATYFYFITRFIEFADTAFFVLTKKFDHVSALHVIHHSVVPICTWLGFTLSPNGHGTLSTLANSGVHVLMYGYYAAAALGPKVRPWLWWKKYLTQLQLIQFVFIFGHGTQVLFRSNCDFPKPAIWTLLGTMVLLFGLFSHFYVQSYVREFRKRRESVAESYVQTFRRVSIADISNVSITKIGRQCSQDDSKIVRRPNGRGG